MDQQELITQLSRQNRLLKQALALGAAGMTVMLLTAAANTENRGKFSEIDVERINIITPEGKQEMVIANHLRLPQPVTNGKQLERGGPQRPGMIFYNATGDENGGFIFDGKLDEQGKPVSGMHFSMDRFGGDQQLSLGHYESNGSMESGLKIYDRGLQKDYDGLYEAYEKAPAGLEKDALLQKWKDAGGQQTNRLFVGKTRGKSSAIIMADAKGKARIMMIVTPEGKPMLNFLDDNGKIIQSLPQTETVVQAK
ncbi:hypothetical protein ACO0LF_13815 [Undibacterium sp. Di27W]|uniref:hypothetical protein n=1 Tax=Undibacterium sp. Di27W TaxID=3413036 RepID=UPI003BF31747